MFPTDPHSLAFSINRRRPDFCSNIGLLYPGDKPEQSGEVAERVSRVAVSPNEPDSCSPSPWVGPATNTSPQKLRIGLSTSVIQGGRSGIARYVFSLLKEFQQDHQPCGFVVFILKNDWPLFDFLNSSIQKVEVPEQFRKPLADIFWHQVILPRWVRKYSLDVIHIPSYRRMLLRAGCPKVATIHDLAPFRLAGKYDQMRMIYGRRIARFLARQQDRIIAVSSATADDVDRFYGIPRKQIEVIQNGLDHDKFNPGDPSQARAWVKKNHAIAEPFFLYVARFEHPAKNHWRLIEAFNGYKKKTGLNWHLVLGGSDWHGAEMIHEKIQQSPYRKEIHTTGFISDEELPTWYRAAQVFVFPSLFEGFGLPPLEAMACACPVICSNRGSLPEIVGHAAVLVDPEDTAALELKMVQLATDEGQRGEFRARGRERVQAFSWARCAAGTIAVYQKEHQLYRQNFSAKGSGNG